MTPMVISKFPGNTHIAGKAPRDSIRGDVMNRINTAFAMSLVSTELPCLP